FLGTVRHEGLFDSVDFVGFHFCAIYCLIGSTKKRFVTNPRLLERILFNLQITLKFKFQELKRFGTRENVLYEPQALVPVAESLVDTVLRNIGDFYQPE